LNLIFPMVIHFTHFEKVTVFRTSARPKVRTEENIETVKRQMEDEPQLSLRQLSQQTELSVLICQRIVRKDLEDLVTAERYRNNILDVFTINSNWLKGIFNKTRLQHARIFVICGNFLHLCCLMKRSLPMCIEAQGYHF
jgi:hypothetical protein